MRPSVAHLPTRLDGLIAGVTPLPADEVGDEDNEDQPCQGPAHSNGDQHVVTILHTLFHCKKDNPGHSLQCPPAPPRPSLRGKAEARL